MDPIYGDIRPRPRDGQEGYVDCFRSLHRTASDWLSEGRSLAEFVAWMATVVPLLPPGSYNPERSANGPDDA